MYTPDWILSTYFAGSFRPELLPLFTPFPPLPTLSGSPIERKRDGEKIQIFRKSTCKIKDGTYISSDFRWQLPCKFPPEFDEMFAGNSWLTKEVGWISFHQIQVFHNFLRNKITTKQALDQMKEYVFFAVTEKIKFNQNKFVSRNISLDQRTLVAPKMKNNGKQ